MLMGKSGSEGSFHAEVDSGGRSDLGVVVPDTSVLHSRSGSDWEARCPVAMYVQLERVPVSLQVTVSLGSFDVVSRACPSGTRSVARAPHPGVPGSS